VTLSVFLLDGVAHTMCRKRLSCWLFLVVKASNGKEVLLAQRKVARFKRDATDNTSK